MREVDDIEQACIELVSMAQIFGNAEWIVNFAKRD